MGKIVKLNGYVYDVSGEEGFETYFKLGKDIDDPMWKEEVEEMNFSKRNRKSKRQIEAKKEDEEV